MKMKLISSKKFFRPVKTFGTLCDDYYIIFLVEIRSVLRTTTFEWVGVYIYSLDLSNRSVYQIKVIIQPVDLWMPLEPLNFLFFFRIVDLFSFLFEISTLKHISRIEGIFLKCIYIYVKFYVAILFQFGMYILGKVYGLVQGAIMLYVQDNRVHYMNFMSIHVSPK